MHKNGLLEPIQQVWSTNLFPLQDRDLISVEKRLAMELISRTMCDLQSREYDYPSELSFVDQTSASCNYNK